MTERSEAIKRSAELIIEEDLDTDDSDADTFAIYTSIIDAAFKKIGAPDFGIHASPGSLQANMIDRLMTVVNDIIRNRYTGSDQNPHPYEPIMKSGLETYLHTVESIYSILEKYVDPETAAHPANYTLIDKLAKLNLLHFLMYRNVYFLFEENVGWFLRQLEKQPDGSVKFILGYPTHAPIPPSIKPYETITKENSLLREGWHVPLSSLPKLGRDIGCPLTLLSSLTEQSWNMYAFNRKRVPRPESILGETSLNGY